MSASLAAGRGRLAMRARWRMIRGSTGTSLALVLLLVALGDWLFWPGSPGFSLVLFSIALIAAALICTQPRGRAFWLALGLGALGIAPLVEETTPLSLFFAALGVCAAASASCGSLPGNVLSAFWVSIRRLFGGPLQLFADTPVVSRWLSRWLERFALGSFFSWVMPVALGSLFLTLFAQANPILKGWLLQFDLSALLRLLDGPRWIFWVLLLLVAWPFAFVRAGKVPGGSVPIIAAAEPDQLSTLFLSESAVFRSLVVFNLLFALHGISDGVFLFTGAELPPGQSYAEFAHRGAYPLMLTALLAGGFAILFSRKSEGSTKPRLMRWLVGDALDGTEHPARPHVGAAARSICRCLWSHDVAAVGVHLDGARSDRSRAGAGAYLAEISAALVHQCQYRLRARSSLRLLDSGFGAIRCALQPVPA